MAYSIHDTDSKYLSPTPIGDYGSNDIRTMRGWLKKHRAECGPSCFDGDQLEKIITEWESNR